MTLDTGLNLLWIALSVFALGSLILQELRRTGRSIPGRLRRVFAVIIVAVALFPMVSASDDEVSFWFLFSHAGQGAGSGVPTEESRDHARQQLARALDSLENCQVSSVWAFTVTLFLLAFVLQKRASRIERYLVCNAGRSPPLA